MGSKLFFSLSSVKPQKGEVGGTVTYVTSDEVPGFVNIAFASLKLDKQGFQEPIWHPNANKIGYCVQGNASVSIRTPGSMNTFSVAAGDVFFIPQGYVHDVINIGDSVLEISFAFNTSKPEVMCLSKAIYSLSEGVFTSTFNTSHAFYDGISKAKKTELIKKLALAKRTNNTDRYKFSLVNSQKTIQTKGGYLQAATKHNLPILDGLGILGFGLAPKGAVEPHWHTNAGELVYIVKGQTRITVLSPNGNVEVMLVNAGQGAFAPASHFHNIENVGKDNVEVIAYFNNAEPDYIGIGEVIGSYSNDELSAIFNVDPSYFDALKKEQEPLVIVPV